MNKKISLSIIIVISLVATIRFFVVKTAETQANEDFKKVMNQIKKPNKDYLTLFGIDKQSGSDSIHRIWAGKTPENSLMFNIDFKNIPSNEKIIITDMKLRKNNIELNDLKINSELFINEKPSEYELTLSYSYEYMNSFEDKKQIIILDRSEINKL